MADARIVDPLIIGDQNLLASNIIEQLPSSSSAVTYAKWDKTATYAAAAVTCFAFLPENDNVSSYLQFGLFTSLFASNVNREPAKTFSRPKWVQRYTAPVWDAAVTYALGDSVVLVVSGFGYKYTSSVASNVGHNPGSWPSQWSIDSTSTSPIWDVAAPYSAYTIVTRISGTTGYGFTSQTNSNLGNDPLAVETLPGASYWSVGQTAPLWGATLSYGSGAIVGQFNGANGAFYESLVPGNMGNDPATATAYWRQVTIDSYDSWASGTTYALGARTTVFAGTRGTVFRSLQAGNLNKPPATNPTWWQWEGESFKSWSSGANYSIGDIVINLSNHHEYEALLASTSGAPKNPLIEKTYWLDRGINNRWRMFDDANTSQSTFGDVIDVTFSVAKTINTVALMNLVASEVQIIATASGVVVYDQTFSLGSGLTTSSYYSWFFDPIIRRTDVLAADLPPYPAMQVRVIARGIDTAVAVGTIIVGHAIALGTTLYGASVGWRDYSRIEADEFGERQIVERGYSKTGTFQLFVDPSALDGVMATLARRRAKASLFIASDAFSSTWIYGFAKAPTGSIDYPTVSYLHLEIEGLI
jgi:hypothetical protein